MKRLQLDYSPHSSWQRNVVGGVTLAVCLLVGFCLLTDQRNLNERISQYESQSGTRVSSQAGRATITSDERQASEATYALNTPWDKMLGALEQVQTVSSGVHLLTVQPNPTKGEVQLGGEAEDFSALMDYMKALRAKPQFSEVVLVNQRLASESSQTKLAFTLLAHWEFTERKP